MALVVFSGKITYPNRFEQQLPSGTIDVSSKSVSAQLTRTYIYRALPIGHDSSVANQTSRITLLNDPALATQAVIHTTIALLVLCK